MSLYNMLFNENQETAVLLGMLGVDKDFFARFGGFSEEYRLLEDWPAWLREAREGRRIGILPEITCLYAAGGVSSQNADAFASEKLRQDMLRCYEREILPYEERLPQSVLKKVRYRYEERKNISDIFAYSGTYHRAFDVA